MSNGDTFLCERLRRLRGARSQGEMARICGLSQQNYSRYESGAVKPKADALHKIATHFGLTIDQLINSDHNPQQPELSVRELQDAGRAYLSRTAAGDLRQESPTAHLSVCPYCAAKEREVLWLRETIRRLQDNFAAALAAVKPS